MTNYGWMHVQRKIKCVPKKSNMRHQRWVQKIVGVKSIRILVKIFFFYINFVGLQLSRQTFGLASGTSVRGKVGFNPGEKGFQLFQLLLFYFIFICIRFVWFVSKPILKVENSLNAIEYLRILSLPSKWIIPFTTIEMIA